MITNDAGQVALAYYQPSQAFVSGSRMPSGKDYVFVTKYKGVCMGWVDSGDVEAILSIKKTCSGCGNKTRQLFNYATEGQVALWTKGGRGDGDSGCGC